MSKRFHNAWTILHFALKALPYALTEKKLDVSRTREYKIISLRLHFYNHLSDEQIEEWRRMQAQGIPEEEIVL